MQNHERALNSLAVFIRENPGAESAVQLRQLIWSLHNNHHVVNLNCLCGRILPEHREAVRTVLLAAIEGRVKVWDTNRALLVADEFQRKQAEKASDLTVSHLADIERDVEWLARTMPPSYSHVQLVRLLEHVTGTKEDLRRGEEDCPF